MTIHDPLLTMPVAPGTLAKTSDGKWFIFDHVKLLEAPIMQACVMGRSLIQQRPDALEMVAIKRPFAQHVSAVSPQEAYSALEAAFQELVKSRHVKKMGNTEVPRFCADAFKRARHASPQAIAQELSVVSAYIARASEKAAHGVGSLAMGTQERLAWMLAHLGSYVIAVDADALFSQIMTLSGSPRESLSPPQGVDKKKPWPYTPAQIRMTPWTPTAGGLLQTAALSSRSAYAGTVPMAPPVPERPPARTRKESRKQTGPKGVQTAAAPAPGPAAPQPRAPRKPKTPAAPAPLPMRTPTLAELPVHMDFGAFQIDYDPAQRTQPARIRGTGRALSASHYRILMGLYWRRGHRVSASELGQDVYSGHAQPSSTAYAAVATIRKTLAESGVRVEKLIAHGENGYMYATTPPAPDAAVARENALVPATGKLRVLFGRAVQALETPELVAVSAIALREKDARMTPRALAAEMSIKPAALRTLFNEGRRKLQAALSRTERDFISACKYPAP